MIEFAVTCLILSVALLIVLLMEPLKDWALAAAAHRDAQAESVLKHSGLLAVDSEEDDE